MSWDQAPAVGHVHQLHAAADAQHRKVAVERRAQQGQLPAIVGGSIGPSSGCGGEALERGIQIVPAREQQAVQAVHHLLGSIQVRWDHHGDPAALATAIG